MTCAWRSARPSKPTIEGLGRLRATRVEVLVGMGNHDVELALTEVRDVFQKNLNQPNSIAQRMTFERGIEAHMQGNRNPLIDFPEWADKINFKSGFGD